MQHRVSLLMCTVVTCALVLWGWWTLLPDARVYTLVAPMGAQWIVITSIHTPTRQVRALCAMPGWQTVVVGDRKTPAVGWNDTQCIYLSLAHQAQLGYAILAHLPENNYGRKNIGYLFAVQHGARVIYETDDDNLPTALPRLLETNAPIARASSPGGGGTANPYVHFGQVDLWPRGYPLDAVNASRIVGYAECRRGASFPVQQGVVDLDPDVDALFRMLYAPRVGHVRFSTTAPPLALAPGTYAPFNAQNTLWSYAAFWGLLLPVTTTMRVCDIWRSYWVQRLLWLQGDELLFLPPTAEQVRNWHNFHADMLEERDLYEKAGALVAALQAWSPPPVGGGGAVVAIVEYMATLGYWAPSETALARAWVADLAAVGYAAATAPVRPAGCAP